MRSLFLLIDLLFVLGLGADFSFSPAFAGQTPSACEQAGVDSRLSQEQIGPLCRGSSSASPVQCFNRVRETAGLPPDDAVSLCHCARSSALADCFADQRSQPDVPTEDALVFCRNEKQRTFDDPVCVKASGTDYSDETLNGTPYTEGRLVPEVHAVLEANTAIDSSDVDISLSGPGQIVLSGRVASDAERAAVVQTAVSASGVDQVIDHLTVGYPSGISADTELESRVNDKIDQDPAFTASSVVDATAQAEHVDLGGIVDTWKERNTATHDAFQAGAKTVTNHIRVREAPVLSARSDFYNQNHPTA